MRWPAVFLLAFLAYLFGPAPVKYDPREPTPLASLAAAPSRHLISAVYPATEPADQARWAGRLAGASYTAAALAVTFEALLALGTAWPTAGLLTLLAGFGSPLWSWASRSDTIEAPAALVTALLLWLAVRATGDSADASLLPDVASGALAPVLWALDPGLGALTPLALLVGVRTKPWTRRGSLLAAGGAGAGALVVLSLTGVGTAPWLPHLDAFDPVALAAYLVSPGRALALFAPITVLATAALLRGDGRRRLVRGCAVAVLVALVHLACLPDPWGPQAFGPALLSPIVPLLAAMAAGLPTRGLGWGSLLAVPVALAHALTVLAGGYGWDARRDLAAHPDAAWDMRDSPFRDLLYGAPTPDEATFLPGAFPMVPGEHPTRAGDSLPWLAFGWEAPEATGTWASGRESWIVLALPPGDYVLTLIAAAPRLEGRGQRLTIERPSGPPVEVAFAGGLWEFQPVAIRLRPQAGITVLKIRPAHAWQPGRGDVRRLTLFLASLHLHRVPRADGPTEAGSRR